MQQPLFKKIEIWRPLSAERALRYNCVQDLSTGRFRVCTADFVDAGQATNRGQARYFIEQLLASDLADPEQPHWFDSLEAAIAAHDADFEN
jgi:hypothetical protein